MTPLARNRNLAFERQNGRCHYCGFPMLEPSCDPDPMACTAEHLIAKQDGGTNAAANIVAAHRICNARRHARKKPMEPEAYMARVRSRVDKGAWFPQRAGWLARAPELSCRA